MKKILINYLGRTGSGPTFSLELAKGFARNGYEVYAILSKNILNSEEWEKEPLIKQILFINTYSSGLQFIKRTTKFILKGRYEIKHVFKDIKFDFIIRTFFHPWAEIVDEQIYKKSVITICHDPQPHSSVNKIKAYLYRKHIKASDEIIVLTKSFIPIVEKNYEFKKEKIHYMPHGRMNMYKEKKYSKAEIYNSNSINFLFFGRIEGYKGLHVLAKAFKLLLQECDNVFLFVVGSGDFHEYKEEFDALQNTTVINRYIEDEEVASFFDGSNIITVLPYLDATQSGVAPIAMEFDSPIIASNTGGLKEQLDNGKIGVFFETGNAKDLKEKMKYLTENSEERIHQIRLMSNFLHSLDWNVIISNLLIELDNDINNEKR